MTRLRMSSVYRGREEMALLTIKHATDGIPTDRLSIEGTLSRFDRIPSISLQQPLHCCYICCGRAFFPLLYVEGNLIAFSERLEAVSLDR